MFPRAILLFVVALCLAGSAESRAQPDSISVSGSATVKRQPSAMRVHVELIGRGAKLDEALAALKQRREAAVEQLQTLKADEKSIAFTDPSLSNSEAMRRQQFEALVAERMSGRGKKPSKGAKLPETFTVGSTLSAEWPLAAKTPEELLLAAQALQEKIKAADLAGSKDLAKPTPEEQELLEEMESLTRDRFGRGDEMPPPGQPAFVFVARVTPEEREKAMAEAFAKAKAQAEQLAQAAGVKLGPLVGLSSVSGGPNFELDDEGTMALSRYNSSYARQRAQRMLHGEGREDESLGSRPESLTFGFGVGAVFGIAKK